MILVLRNLLELLASLRETMLLMKKLIFPFLLSVLISSCNISENDKERFEYNYFESSKLEVEQLQESYMKRGVVSQGDKTVFVYEYHFDEEAMAYDGGFSDYIYFEIDPTDDSFRMTGDELVTAKVTYSKSCFCYFPDAAEKNVNPTGVITGEKISDTRWCINLDITFYGDEKKTFNAIFKLKGN